MNRHLNDREIAAAVAGTDLDAEATEHLASCLACHASVMEMRDLLAARRAQMSSPEPDWQAQRERILDQLGHAGAVRAVRPHRWRVGLLAAAATVLLAIGIAWLAPSPDQVVHMGAEELQVEQVLAEVDALLADDAIPGLWPADPVSDTEDLEALIFDPTS